MENVRVSVELRFNNTLPKDEIPEASAVVEVLVEAVESNSLTFNLTINTTSIKVIDSTNGGSTTSGSTTSVPTTTERLSVVALDVTLTGEQFEEALNNRSSTEYIELEKQVVWLCDFIFGQSFGTDFNQTNVIKFSPDMENVRVSVDLKFNNTLPKDEIPEASAVVEVLVEAVESNSLTFNLTINTTSIKVIDSTNGGSTTSGSTTSVPTTTVDTERLSVVALDVTLTGEQFEEALNNRSSTEYIELEKQVVWLCDFIFGQSFGTDFNQTNVIKFSPDMENVRVSVDLKFNNTLPKDEIPEASAVVEVLVEAVESNSLTFNLTINTTSIKIIDSTNGGSTTSGSTTSVPTTTVDTERLSVVALDVTLTGEQFEEALNNRSSTEYIELEKQVVWLCDFIFGQSFGTDFNQTNVIKFSPDMENVRVSVDLKFNNTLPKDEIPEASAVVEVLVEAVESNSLTFNLTINTTSIKVIDSTNGGSTTSGSTTSVPTTTVDTERLSVVALDVTLTGEQFEEALNNRSSTEYIELEKQVVWLCDFIFGQSFGTDFNQTSVIKFSPDMENVRVSVELRFNNTLPKDEIPEASAVVEVLVEAVESNSLTFNLTINTTSIKVIDSTNGGSTTSGSTTSVPTTTERLSVVALDVTLTGEQFEEALNNRSSTEYIELEKQVVWLCDFIFGQSFGTDFNQTNVIKFSPDMENVRVSVDLKFNNTLPKDEIPEASAVVEVLVEAVESNSLTFNLTINTTSIKVIDSTNGGSTTSGSTTSVPTTTVDTERLSVVALDVTLTGEQFEEALNNRSSTEYIELEKQVVWLCDFIFGQSFGTDFNQTNVIKFSPDMENVRVSVDLKFNNTLPKDEIPEASAVVEVLVEAVESNSLTFNLTINTTSIKIIDSTNGGSTTSGSTTSVPTTTVDTERLSVVALDVTLTGEQFEEALNNRSSTEYIELEKQVVWLCDFIFGQSFGTDFNQTNVIKFSPDMENVRVSVDLKFNNTLPKDEIPEASAVVEVLVEAVESNSLTFNLTINTTSIKVIDSTNGGSTTSGSTTSVPTTTEKLSVVALDVTLTGEQFEEALNNRSSTEYIELEKQVVWMCDFIFGQSFGTDFNQTSVIKFSPDMENVRVSVDLKFNNTLPKDEIPEASKVVEVFVKALENGSNIFNLTINATSIEVIGSTISNGTTTTTAGPTTSGGSTIVGASSTVGGSGATEATVTTSGSTTIDGSLTTSGGSLPTRGSTTIGSIVTQASSPVFTLAATLEEPFVDELSDPNSVQFKALEVQVVTVCDIIYRTRYGTLFIRTIVIRFRRAIVRTRMEGTQAEVALVFNNTVTEEQIPAEAELVKTLQDALANPNNTFNISVDPATIEVMRDTNTTTSSPTAAQTSIATMSSVTTVLATTEQLVTRTLTFRSAGETFTIDLLNPSSSEFINRAAMIKSTLEPVYKATFSSFRNLTVTSFSNGSIFNNMDLSFANMNVPNGTQIANVLVAAASDITAFNIDTSSIFVNGIQVSGGASHKISLLTASFLVLLSLLLSNQQ
ncbi:mucin-22-like [Labrus bergylta]|uniref:mucin-22-like n=1 Tax=Labrus bergylta TaxID=56723 RepID=UPI003313D462